MSTRDTGEKNELLPCPCRELPELVKPVTRSLPFQTILSQHSFECRVCGLRTPYSYTEEGAIKIWNTFSRAIDMERENRPEFQVDEWAIAKEDTDGWGAFKIGMIMGGCLYGSEPNRRPYATKEIHRGRPMTLFHALPMILFRHATQEEIRKAEGVGDDIV